MTDRASALRPAIQAAFDAGGLDAICEFLARLEARFEARIAGLEKHIAELEKRLGKNSSNSSKPPSSDGLRRTKSLRPENTGRRPGGQPGHPGRTLDQSATPDSIVSLSLEVCPECGGDLPAEVPPSAPPAEEKRQIFDLPPLRLEVTEYRATSRICPHCGSLVTAAFPAGVSAPAQYGPGMQALMSYLNVRQLIPCARTAEICQDLLGHRPGAGSVVQAVARCADLLTPAVEEIRGQLAQAPVLHADETGVRRTGKTQWIHVVSDATRTLYSHSPGRGVEGFAAAGVLPRFTGTLVHDFWGPYDTLECAHARCNAHLLRELKACAEDGHPWAEKLITTLLEMKKAADAARAAREKTIPAAHRQRLLRTWDDQVEAGQRAHPLETRPSGKRGRVKQSAETNLLRRLRDKRGEVLRFVEDTDVPFDNNQAERDLRMIKVQQKVSGSFRSAEGARRFCTISSYISTLRKQGLNLMQRLKAAFTGPSVSLPV